MLQWHKDNLCPKVSVLCSVNTSVLSDLSYAEKADMTLNLTDRFVVLMEVPKVQSLNVIWTTRWTTYLMCAAPSCILRLRQAENKLWQATLLRKAAVIDMQIATDLPSGTRRTWLWIWTYSDNYQHLLNMIQILSTWHLTLLRFWKVCMNNCKVIISL